MLGYLSLVRPLNGAMAAIATWTGAIVAGFPIGYTNMLTFPLSPVLLAMISVFLISSGGMAINDYFDAEIDKLNKPKRPIPSGKIKKKSAMAFSIILFVSGIAAAYFINTNALGVAAFAAVLLIAYAAKLKKVIMAGHVSVSLLVGLTFIYGGIAAGNYIPALMMALLAVLSNTAREIYKSIEDVMGDKKHNVTSLPIKLGVLKAKMIANAFVIASVIFSFAPFILGTFGQLYLFFVVIADIGFISAVIAPVRYSAKICKLSMIIALMAFIAAAVKI